MCHHCRQSGAWDILVRLLGERKKSKSFSAKDVDILMKETATDRKVDVVWEQLEKTTQLITCLPDDTVRNIMGNFKLPVRFAKSLMQPTQAYVYCRWSVWMCVLIRSL
jgi:hypothetical protein